MILSTRTLHTPSVVAGDRWARDAPVELHAAHKHMASAPLPAPEQLPPLPAGLLVCFRSPRSRLFLEPARK